MSHISTPSVSHGAAKAYHNENTVIYKELDKFADGLQRLTASIQQYSPDPEIASEMVVTTDKINSELEKIQTLHEMRAHQIVRQNEENDTLNYSLNMILTTLDECRTELNLLPKLSPSEAEKVADTVVSEPDAEATRELLSYAMKLSKFSKIPRTYEGFLLPNNFVWPGDDNMRRGMLAMSSLMPDKVIAAENGEEEKVDEDGDQPMEDVAPVKEEEDVPSPGRRGSVTSKAAKPADQASVMADLDLFDDDD